jgi:hypothetical protein
LIAAFLLLKTIELATVTALFLGKDVNKSKLSFGGYLFLFTLHTWSAKRMLRPNAIDGDKHEIFSPSKLLKRKAPLICTLCTPILIPFFSS